MTRRHCRYCGRRGYLTRFYVAASAIGSAFVVLTCHRHGDKCRAQYGDRIRSVSLAPR